MQAPWNPCDCPSMESSAGDLPTHNHPSQLVVEQTINLLHAGSELSPGNSGATFYCVKRVDEPYTTFFCAA